ncbi:TPA: hypothetical protein ACIVAT_000602 [Salmonella enterica subsp. enterica serovar Waycross]
MSKKTYQLDQMKLFCDIASAIAKQHPKLPADNRANVAIEAAKMIVDAYKMTDEQYVNSRGSK